MKRGAAGNRAILAALPQPYLDDVERCGDPSYRTHASLEDPPPLYRILDWSLMKKPKAEYNFDQAVEAELVRLEDEIGQVNAHTDQITKYLMSVEERISKMGGGIVTVYPMPTLGVIGFNRKVGKWGIAFQCAGDDSETWVRIETAPRKVRLRLYDELPKFIAAIRKEAEKL